MRKFTHEECGRSLVEVMAYMALAGVMMVGGWSVYRMVDTRIERTRADQFFAEIVRDSRILYRNYGSISLDRFLHDTQKKHLAHSPIGASEFTIRSENLGAAFSININGVNYDDCVYFSTRQFDWATSVRVNGYSETPDVYCLRTGDNVLSFWAE